MAATTLFGLLSAASGQERQALTSVKEIRSLGPAEAARGSRLRVQGVVTALSGWRNSFFVQDATGGISVDRKDDTDVQAGDEVEIEGVSGHGLFAPVALAEHVRVLGRGRLPAARRSAYEDLAGGKQDSQWIEVRGIVHSATVAESWGRQVLSLVIDVGGGAITARVRDFQSADLSRFVDATVLVRGVCGTNFTAKRQFVGLRLFVPSLRYVGVEEAASPNPFSVPPVPIQGLLQFDPALRVSHRVKVSGIATHQGLGRALYLQDGGDALLVETSQTEPVEPGSRVEAVGFVAPGEYSPVLRDAVFRKIGSGVPPTPVEIAAGDAIQVNDGFAFAPYSNSLVRLEAEVVEKIRHAQEQILVLRSGGSVFQTRIEPVQTKADGLAGINVGARVRLTGICVMEANEDREPQAFHVLLGSARDIRVLKTPWWTVSNSLWLAGFLFLLSLGMLAWVLQMRRALPARPQCATGDAGIYSDFRLASRMAGGLGAFIGAIVLIGGWAFNIESLRSVLPGYLPMKANTALGFALAGAALWLDQAGVAQAARRWLVQICAGVTALIGLLTVLEHVLGVNLRIDELLFREQAGLLAGNGPGRMAFTSAVGLLLLGSALFVVHRRRGFILGQCLVGLTCGLCLVNVVGCLYGLNALAGISSYTAMALHTSLTFILLCAGVLLSRPASGFMAVVASGASGGAMARCLLPAAMLIPAGLGWLSWQGQLHGFFDTAFCLALFVSANIIFFTLLIWASAGRLNRLDVERSLAEGKLRRSEEQFRALLESAPDAMLMADDQGRIVLVNAKAEVLFGYSRAELLGEPVDKLIPSHASRASRIERLDSAVEVSGTRRDGSEFPAEISLSPIRTAQGIWIANAIRDISVRKSVEQRLSESEHRYRTVVESLPQMVWTCLPDGRCDFLSGRWIEYTGIPEADQIGHRWAEQVHPEDCARIQELWGEALRRGDSLDVEYRVRSAQGEYRWFRALAVPLRDSGGAIAKWFGSSTEIEKLKHAEAALRESEASFRQLADAMPQIVWTAKPDGNLNYYNQRWYDYTGMTFEQTKDWGWQPVVHADDLLNCVDRWTRAFTTGELYEVEYRFKRASDGAYRWHLGRALPVLNPSGQVIRWFGTCTDIEDYKQAEASIRNLNENLEGHVRNRTAQLAKANWELAGTKARLQGLLDAATQVAIIAADTHGLIQVFNSGAEKMLQYTAREMEGLRTPEMLHDPAECLERSAILAREFGRPIEGNEVFVARARLNKSEEREWTYVRKDGSRLDVSLAVTAVRNSSGALEGFLGIATDITARKSLERKLRLNNEKLVEQTRRAEEANRAKSDFLAAMSHEIRTPMNAILGMADVLWDSDLDADQRQYVEVFRRAGSNLLALINDILDLSKIEAGHLELERVEFDLEEVVDQAIELTAPKARAKNIDLLARLSPGMTTALIGDPTRLRQVLINLLGNAVKFTESGEVLLTVQPTESGEPGRIEFAVSDTGIGIPEKKLEAIFEDFTQADSSTTRKYGGTGLGLGISQRLVRQMGGSLTVESIVGQGSTFRFEAPFDLAAGTRSRAEVEDFHGRRVLVIDDNATNRLILHETLNAWGLETDECGLPEDALDSVSRAISAGRPYSLVLVDNRMPGLDGFQTAARITKLDPKLPIVMLTSDTQPGDVARRREHGFAGYAVKPVKRAELLRLVCGAMKAGEGPGPQPLEMSPTAGRKAAADGNGLRILVAEDSPDNRLLVQVYLKGSPHQATFVEDGFDAVDQFAAAAFDLVLMDMQMPVMDGLMATRTIRAIERERGLTPIPVVALTANARPQDVAMSQDAGCTAHITKPISKQKLLAAIEEFGLRRPVDPPALDELQIEIPEGLEELVPNYLAARRQAIPEMLALLAASDFERLRTLAHNMKGTGTSYGFAECTRLGAELEHSANRSDRAALQGQLAQLENYLARVRLV